MDLRYFYFYFLIFTQDAVTAEREGMCREVAGPGLVCVSGSHVVMGGVRGGRGRSRRGSLGLCVSTSGEDL